MQTLASSKIEPSYSVNRPAKVCSHEEDPGKHQRIVKTDKEEELLKVDGEEDAEDKHPGDGEQEEGNRKKEKTCH